MPWLSDWLSGSDPMSMVRLLLAGLVFACLALLVAVQFERRRRVRLINALSLEVDRLVEEHEFNASALPRDKGFGTLIESVEKLMASVASRNAESMEATSTNRLMARELKRLTRLLDSSSEGLIALDNAQKVLFANQAAGSHLSMPPEAAAGKRVQECLRDDRIVALLSADADDAMQEGVRTVELSPKPEYGHGHLTAMVAACNDDAGDPLGHLILFRDVDELKTLRRQQIDFVEHLAEEFRVPLTAVRAHTETMAASPLGQDGAVREACAAIRDEGRRLGMLLDNLVIVSRIEAGSARAETDAVPLRALLEAVVDAAQPECAKKGIALSTNLAERLPTLYVDETLLRLALMNVLTNAIQYTDEGGTITVETASHEEDLQVSIRDTGRGIEEAHFESIFQKFFRCPESDRVPGSGIGLAVARQIARLHGGDIDVNSHFGHGSQFTFVLPRALLRAPSADAPAA